MTLLQAQVILRPKQPALLELTGARATARDQVGASWPVLPRSGCTIAINIEEPTRLEMAITIGEKLRLAREERGISLRDISEQTRISMRYLEAIESDDYKRLPGGIFNRSFIKSYARYIGYDEKEAIEAYATTLRQKGEPSEEPTTLPKSLVYTDATSSRSPLLTLLLAIIILGVLSLGAYAALHWYQRRTAPRGSSGPGQSVKLTTAVVAGGCERRGEEQHPSLPGEVSSSC